MPQPGGGPERRHYTGVRQLQLRQCFGLATVSDGVNNAVYSYLANSPLVAQIAFRQNTTVRMTTSKVYDRLNRLTSIHNVGAADAVSSAYEYNNANQRVRVMLADGSYWRYEYDTLGQVVSGRKYWTDNTPVAGRTCAAPVTP